MVVLHRRYEVHPRWSGTEWELHVSGVGMITTDDLGRAYEVTRAYIGADLGLHALHDAEIVLLPPFPPVIDLTDRLQVS
jgi:hypothetical protein